MRKATEKQEVLRVLAENGFRATAEEWFSQDTTTYRIKEAMWTDSRLETNYFTIRFRHGEFMLHTSGTDLSLKEIERVQNQLDRIKKTLNEIKEINSDLVA